MTGRCRAARTSSSPGTRSTRSAQPAEYENRFLGPFKAALPWTDADHPVMYAIPGNHDWYDGLTGFMRVFGQETWVGGRQTKQRRSYFAIGLPHRHWLWGIDIQNDAYVDSAQIAYFRRAGDVDEARRPADPLLGQAELDRRRGLGRLPQPRVRRAQARRPRASTRS